MQAPERGPSRSSYPDPADLRGRKRGWHPCRRVRRGGRRTRDDPEARRPRRYGVEHGRPLDTTGQEGRLGPVRARVYPDYEAICAAAADTVAQKLSEKPTAVFMLPTGTTPLGMYRYLAEMHHSEGLSFTGTTFFNLDEYLGLRPDHEASYHVYMKENFYGLIDADPARIFVPDGTAPDPEAECELYEAAIVEAGGVAAAVEGDVSESVPASMLKNHPNARLFLDEDAASDLGHGVAG